MPREVSLNLNDHAALLLDMYLDELRSRIILEAANRCQQRIGDIIEAPDIGRTLTDNKMMDREFLERFFSHVAQVYQANKPNSDGRVKSAEPGAASTKPPLPRTDD